MVYEVSARFHAVAATACGSDERLALRGVARRRRTTRAHQLTPLSLGQGRPRRRELLAARCADAHGSQTRVISSGG